MYDDATIQFPRFLEESAYGELQKIGIILTKAWPLLKTLRLTFLTFFCYDSRISYICS
jgi:hypothetical protein